MYGWNESSDDLAQVDKATGEVTNVGESGLGTFGDGMSFDRDGVLYAMLNGDQGVLRAIDTATGLTTVVFALSGAPQGGEPIPAAAFRVDLSAATGGATIGIASETVTITANDVPVAAPAPPGVEPPVAAPAPPGVAPSLTSARVTRRAFLAIGTGRRGSRSHGTRFQFGLSEAANVRITIRRASGARVTAFAVQGRSGANSRAFSGRVNGRALHPGLYVAKLRATGATGLRSTTRTVRFRILAAPPSSPTAPRFTG